jgi:hypothetical protein
MTVAEIFYCLAVGIAMIVAMSILLNEKRAGISPTPTMPGTRRAVIDLLSKHIGASRSLQIAELGSGWGGLVVKLANAFPNAMITGFEISPWPRLISRIITIFNSRIIILNEDFFSQDWSRYDVLVCYLSPQHMARIEAQLNQLHRKPLVISCAFSMPNAIPSETVTIRQIVHVNIYVYNSRLSEHSLQ